MARLSSPSLSLICMHCTIQEKRFEGGREGGREGGKKGKERERKRGERCWHGVAIPRNLRQENPDLKAVQPTQSKTE